MNALRAELDEVWSLVKEDNALMGHSDQRLKRISQHFLKEGSWTPFHPPADDAVSSIYHAAKAAMFGDPQDAATAAEHVYNALDNYVIDDSSIDVSRTENEKTVAADTRVQQELDRQERDINELGAPELAATNIVVERVKARAQTERAIPE